MEKVSKSNGKKKKKVKLESEVVAFLKTKGATYFSKHDRGEIYLLPKELNTVHLMKELCSAYRDHGFSFCDNRHCVNPMLLVCFPR